jgi:heptosyltransferase-2
MNSIAGLAVNTDCLFFKGDLPCGPHKKSGYHCADCPAYEKISKRILIIKLGAIGDVIRTTPLIRKIRAVHPNAKITWLTHTPAILPNQAIDEILKYDFANVLYVQQVKFDIVYNLDKDKDACALVNTITATDRFGYQKKMGYLTL